MGAREEVGSIILDMKRHGFRQLRKTDHGWLYGFKEFRMHVPNAMAQPGAVGQAGIDDLRKTWEAKRAEVLGAYPGLKLSVAARGASGDRPDTLTLAPVLDIEDVLRDTGGQPVADAGPVQPAGAGSTPAPPASAAVDADARRGPGIATPAPAGSSPAIGTPPTAAPPNNREEDDLAKRKRKAYDGWVCPKCGDTFKTPGRHAGACTGKPKSGTVVAVRRKAGDNGQPATGRQPPAGSRHSPVQVVAAGDFIALVSALEASSTALCTAVRALVTERDYYKRERDEAVGRLERVTTALAGAGVKPRGGA